MAIEINGMIGHEPKFYGYIMGLQMERGDLPDSPDSPRRMFARFEYGYRTSVWEVPDYDLFALLSEHLCTNAEMMASRGCGPFSKLWIEYKDGQWIVDLP